MPVADRSTNQKSGQTPGKLRFMAQGIKANLVPGRGGLCAGQQGKFLLL